MEALRPGSWIDPARSAIAMGERTLHEIRRQDLSWCSDLDLRELLTKLGEGGGNPADHALPMVYAVTSEAMSRRLGTWRLFEASSDVEGLEVYRERAKQVLASDAWAATSSDLTGGETLEGADLEAGLAPLLTGMGLGPAEQTIVATIAYVMAKSKVSYPFDILLSSDFYRALTERDVRHVLSFHPTDEQLLAGVLLYKGNIVEMLAGEGKTIAAAFPAILHATAGRAVHIMTANDYLAARDAALLAPVYESLGLRVDFVVSYMGDPERKQACRQPIVYGTLREFGFDFMRDNLRSSPAEHVQGQLQVAIVDEADHILIDEARTPLIIAGSQTGTRREFARIRGAIEGLIALQAETLSALERELRGTERSSGTRNVLMARLLLADPENGAVRREFAEDPGCYSRVQVLLERLETGGRPGEGSAEDLWYLPDVRTQSVTLTEKGQDFLESRLGPLFATHELQDRLLQIETSREGRLVERRRAATAVGRRLARQYHQASQVHQMLRGYLLLKRDVDYVVADDAVVLIDPLTGRARPDSRYQQGLQAALESKEGVSVHPDYEALAQVSVQGFMEQYRRIAGMTGTALSSRGEFARSYRLNVLSIPPTRPGKRADLSPRLYTTRRDKLAAILDEVRLCHRVGRPVLLGTLTLGQSEEISALLQEHGIRHNLLNAVNNAHEAQIVRDAGAFGAVTVATNLAGRGTDIVLERGLDACVVGQYRDLVQQLLAWGAKEVVLEAPPNGEADVLWADLSKCDGLFLQRERRGRDSEVITASQVARGGNGESVNLEFGLGLHVIGTELNDSRRIDLQLKGRCGRQGEFGSSRFLLSLEDRAFLFSADKAVRLASEPRYDAAGRSYFQGRRLDRYLGRVQATIESNDATQRDLLQQYARVSEAQGLFYYGARKEIMEADSFHEVCGGFLRERARRMMQPESSPDWHSDAGKEWFERLAEEVWTDYRVDCSSLADLDVDSLAQDLGDMLVARLEHKRSQFREGEFSDLEKFLFLQVSDELWKDHIAGLQDALPSTQMSAQSRGGALVEYMRRGFEAYGHFREGVIDTFLPRLVRFPASRLPAGLRAEVALPEDISRILV